MTSLSNQPGDGGGNSGRSNSGGSNAGGSNAGGERKALYQPPNPEDMHRTPPAEAACARVRGLLRDFADNDLAPAMAAVVAEHVHSCRVCAVELARAEHEVLRLRRAFEEVRAEEQAQPELSLRPDFAARVVEQLVMTDGAPSDSSPSDSDPSDSSPSDASRDGHSQNSHSQSVARTKRASSFASPAGMLVAGLFALFALTVGMRVFVDDVAEPGPAARLEVTFADDAFGAGRRPLAGGDVLGEQQGVWVPRGSVARMDWHDLSERIQPAASLEVQDGELQFRDGAPVLVGGRVVVETNRGVEIPMKDGSRVALGMGEYVIAAIPTDMRSDEAFEPLPAGMFEGEVRLEVEVRSGDPAIVLRAGAPPQRIAAGNTGSYQGNGAVDLFPTGPVAAGPDRDRIIPPTPQPPPMAAISGHVFGPNSQPSVGASVWLQYAAGASVHTGAKVTGANGSFVLPTEIACESSFAIALSLPSSLRPELGMSAADAVPVLVQNGIAQLQQPLEIAYSTAISGVAVDETEVPIAAVAIIPCIIDELFGSVSVLSAKQTWSNADGRFLIEQLPARLPHHQRLVLMLSHANYDVAMVPVPVRGSPVASSAQMVCTVPSLRTVSLHGLPPMTNLTFLEEVAGLPVGSGAVRRTFTTNSIGGLPFIKVGKGRLWLRTGSTSNPLLREIIFQQVTYFTVGQPSVGADDYDIRFRPLQAMAGTSLKLVNSYRHQSFQVAPVVNIVESQFLHVTDTYNQNVTNAQVFAVRQSSCYDQPDPRFIGFTGANGTLSLGAIKANEDAFVIGPDGALSWLTRPTASSSGVSMSVSLQPTGRVLLGEPLRPDPGNPERVVRVIFRRSQEMLLGMVPEAVRFATDGNWEMSGLPAGSYLAEVDGVTYPIVVPSMGFAVLTTE